MKTIHDDGMRRHLKKFVTVRADQSHLVGDHRGVLRYGEGKFYLTKLGSDTPLHVIEDGEILVYEDSRGRFRSYEVNL